jgi:hypothetical protein
MKPCRLECFKGTFDFNLQQTLKVSVEMLKINECSMFYILT